MKVRILKYLYDKHNALIDCTIDEKDISFEIEPTPNTIRKYWECNYYTEEIPDRHTTLQESETCYVQDSYTLQEEKEIEENFIIYGEDMFNLIRITLYLCKKDYTEKQAEKYFRENVKKFLNKYKKYERPTKLKLEDL